MQLDDSFLSAREKAELHALADNDVAVIALKKLVLHSVYSQGTLEENKEANPTLNFAFQLVAGPAASKTNDQVGAELRARWEGANFVEAGFSDLVKYKTATAPTAEEIKKKDEAESPR